MDIEQFLLETNFDEAAKAAQKSVDEQDQAASEIPDDGDCDGCKI